MPHNAEDVIEQVDWEEWPELELFGESDGDDAFPSPDEDAA
ncbi:MAG TPA: hypothetical protein VE736_09365 [Gaiellaceae bacterium]|jgi:hypothetical protein|nr:hypothetical protein [Gaiellaceae bacterium]